MSKDTQKQEGGNATTPARYASCARALNAFKAFAFKNSLALKPKPFAVLPNCTLRRVEREVKTKTTTTELQEV